MVVFLGSENSKCQVLANFSFLGAEGIGEGLGKGRGGCRGMGEVEATLE